MFIKQLKLKFGARPSSRAVLLGEVPMTLFVGPNNGGKSLALREIETYARSGHQRNAFVIDEMQMSEMSREDATVFIDNRSTPTSSAEGSSRRIFIPSLRGGANTFEFGRDWAIELLEKGGSAAFGSLTSAQTLRLDGHTRLTLLDRAEADDLQSAAGNLLSTLFRDDNARARAQQISFDAFGMYLVIDPTAMKFFRARLARRPPVSTQEEQGLTHASRLFHAEARELSEFSDGVKAFLGVVTAFLSSEYRLMLCDEPEAFLYPPLSKRLGRIVADLAAERKGSAYVATHSADFLMGVVESGRDAAVVRLTYDGHIATARTLDPTTLREFMYDPLLRSTGLLAALFHRGAVICEADSDRAFYQEIASRLDAVGQQSPTDTIYLNAHSKDVLHRLARPLRQIGVPAAVIVDLDVLKKQVEFNSLLRACAVPAGLLHSWSQLRGTVLTRFDKAQVNMKVQGIFGLQGSDQAEALSLLDNLANYGVFVVPVGEAERWLANLNALGHGNEWLTNIFRRMGSNTSAADYLRPTVTLADVWAFMAKIAAWIRDPDRLGIPDQFEASPEAATNGTEGEFHSER